jgi:hypothetical protein
VARGLTAPCIPALLQPYRQLFVRVADVLGLEVAAGEELVEGLVAVLLPAGLVEVVVEDDDAACCEALAEMVEDGLGAAIKNKLPGLKAQTRFVEGSFPTFVLQIWKSLSS